MQSLDDALAVTTTNDAKVIGAGGSEGVEARIEALLGGEPAPEPTPKKAEKPSEETSEETAETEETPDDEEVDEDESEDEDDDSEDDEDSEDEEESEEIELTEDQLAASLGVKPGSVKLDEDGNVLIKTKVDGKVEFATLNELRDSFVRESNFTQKAQTLASERKQFEETTTKHVQHMTQQVADATALVHALEQQLMSDLNGLDLNQIKATDPGRWAAINQELGERQRYIQQTKAQLHQTISQGQQQQQQKAQQQRQQLILDEADKLLTAFPKWQDPEVATADINETKKLMIEKYGIPEEVVSTMPYAGFILMARDAMKAVAFNTDADTVKKKLKSVPKIVKPGKRSKTSGTRADQETAKRQSRLKSEGSTDALAAVLLDRI